MKNKLEEYFQEDALAIAAWSEKYAASGEVTPEDMHERLAAEFARIDEKYQKETEQNILFELSKYGKSRKALTKKDIFKFFANFKYIIPQGSIMSQLGVNKLGSLSNCFVIGQPKDSYGGIFWKDQELAQLMKRRGGVGLDISTLRPKGTEVKNVAGSSTGAVSFMPRYSNTTREVAQDGRRGALMLSISIKHPDSLDFIKIKRDLNQVTGANISVKLDDEFMEAVTNDKDFILRFPIESNFTKDLFSDQPYNELIKTTTSEGIVYIKRIKAREYWNEIIKSAHSVAEPGLMFWDSIVDYSPDGLYKTYKQVTSNPCGEIPMAAYDACRLLALNLFSFVDEPFTDKAKFNFNLFYEMAYEAQRQADNLIDLELEAINKIINKIILDPEDKKEKTLELALWQKIAETAENGRRTGLGFTALADMLAALGLKYDSKETAKIVQVIMHTKMRAELDCTIDLAGLRGSFKDWDSATEYPEGLPGNTFYKTIQDDFPEQKERMLLYGRRNISWSTVAPTGTVSIVARTSSGIEPVFKVFYTRRKKINPNDGDVKADYVDAQGDKWREFTVLHPKFKLWMDKTWDFNKIMGDQTSIENLQIAFEQSPWFNSTANDISWKARVDLQAIIQKYTSHSISSTINLPENISEEIVGEIYMYAWQKGLKGITVYRDNSRGGVLISKKTNFESKDALKRPKVLKADVHFATFKLEKFTGLVGLFEDKPYEVFITEDHLKIDKVNTLTKKKSGVYQTQEGIEVALHSNPEIVLVTRLLSISLRHGVDIKFIVEQLNKIDGDLFSFAKVLARILKKYIPDGAVSTVKCPECGDSSNMVFEEGCLTCKSCSYSKCG